MLYNDLYNIDSLVKEEGTAKAVLSLKVSHPIFKGHFPGQPVLPGACMLQMIKEIMEIATGQPLKLQKAHHIKFIALIDPSKDAALQMQLVYKTDQALHVTATIMRSTNICLKFSGEFVY